MQTLSNTYYDGCWLVVLYFYRKYVENTCSDLSVHTAALLEISQWLTFPTPGTTVVFGNVYISGADIDKNQTTSKLNVCWPNTTFTHSKYMYKASCETEMAPEPQS